MVVFLAVVSLSIGLAFSVYAQKVPFPDDWEQGAGPEPEEVPEETPTVIDVAYRADTIKKAIYALPEGYRIVLSLILLEGYDHEEVSGILQISNATSRTQYHRAKKKLLELLKKTDLEND